MGARLENQKEFFNADFAVWTHYALFLSKSARFLVHSQAASAFGRVVAGMVSGAPASVKHGTRMALCFNPRPGFWDILMDPGQTLVRL